MTEAQDNRAEIRRRLQIILDQLLKEGITQRAIAQRVGVPGQYLSDVKVGRKPLTELFARRLGEAYEFDYGWLMMTGSVAPSFLDAAERQSTAVPKSVRLPVFNHPVAGNPWALREWNGASIELSGVAALQAQRAKEPYVLCYGRNAPDKRLRRNDLLLMSQEKKNNAEIQVVRRTGDLVLAYKSDNGTWRRVADDQALARQVEVVGHCLAIVWRSLAR